MLKEQDKKIILALADNSMQVKPTARQLYLHWNTVYYRIDRIWDETGLNPRNFYDLNKLVEMVKKEKEDGR